MCFSSTASFVASGVLLPLGLYSGIKAFKINKNYLLFALIPFVFGIHQFIEGIVWDAFHEHAYTSMYQSACVFIFIAFFVWPMYVPLSVYFIESHRHRKKILLALFFCGVLLGIVSYGPLFIGTVSWHVAVVHHSITYPVHQPTYLSIIYITLYVMIILISLFICSKREIKMFGALLLVALIFTIMCFYFALASVWCFFAALLSLYIVRYLHTLGAISRQS